MKIRYLILLFASMSGTISFGSLVPTKIDNVGEIQHPKVPITILDQSKNHSNFITPDGGQGSIIFAGAKLFSNYEKIGNKEFAEITKNYGKNNVDFQDIFIRACRLKEGKTLKTLIKKQVIDVNQQDLSGCTPLHYVCQNFWDDELLKLILQMDSDNSIKLNVQNNEGATALHIACNAQNDIVVKALLEQNQIDVNIMDNYGLTPFDYAQSNKEIQAILSKHRGISGKNLTKSIDSIPLKQINNGNNVPQINKLSDDEIKKVFFDACKTGDLDTVKACLDKIPNLINETAEFNNTPLHIASLNGHKEIVLCLLEKKCDVNKLNSNGKTAGAIAYECYYDEICEKLQWYNAHDTFLHQACRDQNVKTMKELLDDQFDPYEKNDRGETPFNIVLNSNNEQLVTRLLFSLCRLGNIKEENFELLVERYPQVINKVDEVGGALYRACQGGHIEIVKWLLNHSVNVNQAGAKFYTPLDAVTLMKKDKRCDQTKYTELESFLKGNGALTRDELRKKKFIRNVVVAGISLSVGFGLIYRLVKHLRAKKTQLS